MTKADLVEEVVKVTDVSKKHAEIIVNTVFSSIVDALQRDDKIELWKNTIRAMGEVGVPALGYNFKPIGIIEFQPFIFVV